MFERAGMYDEKHRFLGLSREPAIRVKTFQKGLRERLLCWDCEQQFGRYENYASMVFYGDAPITSTPCENFLLLGALEYKPLKLFFLSLLWRFGVTTLEQYRGAKLGPHLETLRRMLRAEDPGVYDTYPCHVTAIFHHDEHFSDLIVPPASAHFEGYRVWSFVVGGFLLAYWVCSHSPPPITHVPMLKPDGTMMLQANQLTRIEFLHGFLTEISKAQKIRGIPPCVR